MQHKVYFTISVGVDNSAIIVRSDEDKVNNNNKCTLYPPPSA
jgi:hypothetical protein